MAEVLTPILQTSTSTIVMLPGTDNYHVGSSAASHAAANRLSSVPRNNVYTNQNASLSYRGISAPPVAPYAFQTTPHLRQSSAPVFRGQPQQMPVNRLAYPASSSSNSTASSSSSNVPYRNAYAAALAAKDDAMLAQRQQNRQSTNLAASISTPDLLQRSITEEVKPSPDRYRRVQRRTQSSSNMHAHMAQDNSRYSVSLGAGLPQAAVSGADRPPHLRTTSADDLSLASRYRRRSVVTIDATTHVPSQQPAMTNAGRSWASVVSGQKENQPPKLDVSRPSYHQRRDSERSVSSSGSPKRPSSARQDSSSSPKTSFQSGRPTTAPHGSSPSTNPPSSRNSVDTSKRLTAPSPLSRPVTADPRGSKIVGIPAGRPQSPEAKSPAMQQLSALSEKDLNKGVKSRLRRAFSFGSSQELKKASGEATTAAERQQIRAEGQDDSGPLNDEEAAVVAKQEAAGLGVGIYSGQGAAFGSTDNISVSSTASSASMMLRKMGRGMKKSTRSIKGLFRPKSVIGVPAADGPLSQGATTAEVSLVTVEAERERVNINVDPHDHSGGGTGFPRLERNSLEAGRPLTPDMSRAGHDRQGSWGRKSIAGTERDRADVLAAVKKGILKRVATDTTLELSRRAGAESPSSVPGTPDSTQAPNNVYFLPGNRYAISSTKSLPNGLPRNISFASKVQFHDVWSATEYDRRGDVATCNRLTPLLAQQIKEELNTFKMEMEVHEMSKPHTHFF